MGARLIGARRAKLALACALAALVPLGAAGEARGGSVRVPREYFGVNFQALVGMSAAARERHLSEIEALGLRTVRLNLVWQIVEPEPPAGAEHRYRFELYDELVADAARHRVRVQPTIVQTPEWNTSPGLLGDGCDGAPSRRPVSLAPFAELAGALARRYGRGGSFWAARPELRPQPFRLYELWNEPNLAGTWCPYPEPERFAEMAAAAAAEIRAADPRAVIALGGLAAFLDDSNPHLPIEEFVRRMLAHRPALAGALDAVAVHAFSSPIPRSQLERAAALREMLRAGGIADATPMLVNELGWQTRVEPGAIAERVRAEAYVKMARKLSRTNCNIAGVLPHTWVSEERDPSNPDDWLGIADPLDGAPYPTARRYARAVRLMRGRLRREPPRRTIRSCPGMPRPDADGDNRRDERDYHPLDPRRWRPPCGARRWPRPCR